MIDFIRLRSLSITDAIICLLMLFTLPLHAQVEGHSYYCWSGVMETTDKTTVKDSVSFDLLLEYEPSTKLVMGEIRYHRPTTVAIHLYGKAEQSKKGKTLSLTEVLPSSSCAGKITLQINNDEQCTDGVWESIVFIDEDSSKKSKRAEKKKLNITQSLPFPHQQVKTFFTPLSDHRLLGVFKLNNCGGDRWSNYNKVELSPLIDSIYIANFTIADYPTEDNFFLLLHKKNDHSLEVKSKKIKLNIQAEVFEDCIYFNVIEDGYNNFDPIKPIYIRQNNQEAFTYPHIDGKSQSLTNFISVRRDGDEITVQYNPLPLLYYYKDQKTIPMFTTYERLTNVRPGIKQIFLANAGVDERPILSILNQDSTLQIFSLIDGFLNHSNKVSDPLPDLTGIVDFAFHKEGVTNDVNKKQDNSTYYVIDNQSLYHAIPVNRHSIHRTYDKIDTNGVTTHHDLEMTADWSIHYKLDVDKDETFGPYSCEYFGNCWTDATDDSVIHYTFNQMIDTRDPGNDDFIKPCRIKGSFSISTDEEDKVIIKPIKGLSFN